MVTTPLSWLFPHLSRFQKFDTFLSKHGFHEIAKRPPINHDWNALRTLERKRKIYATAQYIIYIILFSSVIAAILSDVELTALAHYLQNISGIVSSTVMLILLFLMHYILWLNDADQQLLMALIIAKCERTRSTTSTTGPPTARHQAARSHKEEARGTRTRNTKNTL